MPCICIASLPAFSCKLWQYRPVQKVALSMSIKSHRFISAILGTMMNSMKAFLAHVHFDQTVSMAKKNINEAGTHCSLLSAHSHESPCPTGWTIVISNHCRKLLSTVCSTHCSIRPAQPMSMSSWHCTIMYGGQWFVVPSGSMPKAAALFWTASSQPLPALRLAEPNINHVSLPQILIPCWDCADTQ